MARTFNRAILNPAPPRQLELHHKLNVKLQNKSVSSRGDVDMFLLVYMEDLTFTNDGSLPAKIEQGILDLEDRGIGAIFGIHISAMRGPGKPHFTPIYVEKPRDPNRELQDFPYVAHIELYNWPSEQAQLDLLHELDHVAQWIGTGLIRVAENEVTRDAFTLDIGFGLYGLPKKKYRTYQEVPDIQPTGARARLRQEFSYDEEFYPYVQDIAHLLQQTGKDVDSHFDELYDLMGGSPGSTQRGLAMKRQVQRLLARNR